MSAQQHDQGLVAVIGLGLMGRSIVACLLAAGHRVIGVTDDRTASDSIHERIAGLLNEMHDENLLSSPPRSVLDDFMVTDDLSISADAIIIFESVTEDLALKRSVLHDAERVVSPTCILATNTSALPVTLLQEGALHPERFLGIHWDEPAHVTRFMEIIPGRLTAKEYLDRVALLAPLWGKEPSILKKEIRGFITNRISYAMFREACNLVDSGVCTVDDVDRSLRNDVGWWIPFVGPFRYMDLMGVQGYHRVMRDLLPDLSTEKEIPKLMRDVVESGGRGISNGRGFYSYTEEEARAWEARFLDFNYRIRRLTAEFSDLAPKVSKSRSDN